MMGTLGFQAAVNAIRVRGKEGPQRTIWRDAGMTLETEEDPEKGVWGLPEDKFG